MRVNLASTQAGAAALLPPDVRWMNAATRVLLGTFGAIVLAAGAGWLLRQPSLVLAGITVTGDVTHNNAVTLRANVAPRLRGNFFTLDLAQARAAFEFVPWVRRAVVRREFPNRLRVELQEHQAVALWGAEVDSRLVNSHGEVFDANVGDVELDNLPRLHGPDALTAARALELLRLITPTLAALDLSVQQLVQSAGGSWQATLDSGAVIELGRGSNDELMARVERFVQTVTSVAGRYGRRVDAVESADLRHPNGYALRLRGVSTVAEVNRNATPR